jgi:hypothetical protein
MISWLYCMCSARVSRSWRNSWMNDFVVGFHALRMPFHTECVGSLNDLQNRTSKMLKNSTYERDLV